MAVEQATQQWITVALEEYKTLRQESLAAIEQMQRTLQIGLVAIGVLTAFGVDAVDTGEGAAIGLALATPMLAALIAALRLDELHRTVAAGLHVAGLERRIASKVGDVESPLTWESRVQEKFKPVEDVIRHSATLIVLFAAAAPAVLLGIHEYDAKHDPARLIAGVGLIFAFTCCYHALMLTRVAKLHRTASTPIGDVTSFSGPPQTAAAHQG